MPPGEDTCAVLLASLFSALSHDLRASVNGINVWTHILERVSDPTAVRAVEGIRRSIAQQTDLAQELSDFGRESFGAPDESSVELGMLLRAVCEELGSDERIRLHSPHATMHVAMAGRAASALLRLTLQDALAALSERGHVDVLVDEADARRWRIRIEMQEPDGMPADAHARRPLRQTLAILSARIHEVELVVTPGQRELLLPNSYP